MNPISFGLLHRLDIISYHTYQSIRTHLFLIHVLERIYIKENIQNREW